ncbi:hypothetical protein ABZX90_38485 [Streptomyces sp. NPDC002935]|uniref:tetratricopeptide repeat protein n=1 Tax=Streptomyces sp. NPDC002935 TaxID=3154545 RepID=UPI0033B5110A
MYEALRSGARVPSAQTVAALARVLKLPVEELLELRRRAAALTGPDAGDVSGPGRPLGDWDPHDLEVHPAGHAVGGGGVRVLPGYVLREHDELLARVVRKATLGHSQMAVLVGTSSTGKTRACWQAVQPLAGLGWRLWHPFDPTRADAALADLKQVGPKTVVWLNEAQHYLGDRTAGERIAAAVHHLLVSPERGPVLVLGTLWPEYAHQYTALPAPGGEDPHSRVRELLSGRTLTVPDAFDADALAAAAAVAEGGDRLLADALTRARTDGRVTQDLAGAPELLNRYQHASPAATALLEAAMDARCLGVGPHLPQAFLTDAAIDYLTNTDYDQLTYDWAEQAFAELAQLVHGKQAPLRRATPRAPRRPSIPSILADTLAPSPAGPVFRLADYLEQHGRTTRRRLCPPASFWSAAHTRLTHPDDLSNLTQAAMNRHRLQWAHLLRSRVVEHGGTDGLDRLAVMREQTGDWGGADYVHTYGLYRLAVMLEEAEDRKSAERLLRQAAEYGNTDALYRLARMREEAGDRQDAEALALKAAEYGNTDALHRLAGMREKAGDQEGAEALALKAAEYGNTDTLHRLARMRKDPGDRERAFRLLRQSIDHSDTDALYRLAVAREEAGDQEGAFRLLQQAADHGDTEALYALAGIRKGSGDQEGAKRLLQQAADHSSTGTLYRLAVLREDVGDCEGAETLALKAADQDDVSALYRLAGMREEAGDRKGAESLVLNAADRGRTDTRDIVKRLWLYGLDADGTPTSPWQPSASAPLDRHLPPGTA